VDVRLRKGKGCRSVAWWGFFICTLLLVGAYVLFDLLDVDGSQMNRWPGHDMMVVATPEAAAERFFRADLATSSSDDLIAHSLFQLSFPKNCSTSPATMLLRIRQRRGLPRLNLAREQARGSSPSIDPI
jgi:hypothetical protein